MSNVLKIIVFVLLVFAVCFLAIVGIVYFESTPLAIASASTDSAPLANTLYYFNNTFPNLSSYVGSQTVDMYCLNSQIASEGYPLPTANGWIHVTQIYTEYGSNGYTTFLRQVANTFTSGDLLWNVSTNRLKKYNGSSWSNTAYNSMYYYSFGLSLGNVHLPNGFGHTFDLQATKVVTPYIVFEPDFDYDDHITVELGGSLYPFNRPEEYYTFTQVGYRLLNTENQFASGGAYLYYRYTYSEELNDNEYAYYSYTSGMVTPHQIDGKYYVFLLLPIALTDAEYNLDSFEIRWGNDNTWYSITPTISLNAFYLNYDALKHNFFEPASSSVSSAAYTSGYSAGFVDGSQRGNNLVYVMWTVFEMPFKLLFGTYDTERHVYVNGLLTFDILGVNMRAFVLGLMSICIIIAIIKLISGKFGR